MTLPLETAAIGDQYTRRAVDLVAQQFPVTPPNALGAIPTSTATLPTGTFNGQDFYYVLSTGGAWHFKYNTSAAKWDFAGGPPLEAEVATGENTASTIHVDLATAGPSVTLPFAGDYLCEFGSNPSSAVGEVAWTTVKLNAAASTDTEAFSVLLTAGNSNTGSRLEKFTGRAVNDVLKLQYRTTAAGTITFSRRWISVTPLRVS